MSGTLYLVATPIGNLDDITLRAIKVLNEVDFIAAEDTRHSLKLLNHLEISKPLISYHRHNEDIKSELLIEKLSDGKNVALITSKAQVSLEIIYPSFNLPIESGLRPYLSRQA